MYSELWQSVSTAICSCHLIVVLPMSHFSAILCPGAHSRFNFCSKCRNCCLPKLAAYHCMLSSLHIPYDCLAFLKVDNTKTVILNVERMSTKLRLISLQLLLRRLTQVHQGSLMLRWWMSLKFICTYCAR